jgi:predicted Zn-dependent protease with MMP-like domain
MTKQPEQRRGRRSPLADQLLERIDRAWDALEQGYIEEAGEDAETLMEETGDHPEARFLFGAALLESGFAREALTQLLECQHQVEDTVLLDYYLASALYESLDLEKSEGLFRQVVQAEPTAAPPHYGLAQVLEGMGRYDEAEKSYEEAHRLEPEAYPLPIRMTEEAFEAIVAEAVELLPAELRPHADKIPIRVEALPTLQTLSGDGSENPITPGVLGLFVGPSLKDPDEVAGLSVPPMIFIYQRNLERFCQTREELIYEIRLTLYHEFGHYLGLSEEELEERGLS